MKNKFLIPYLLLGCLFLHSQNSTFNPYSRYGLGEIAQSTFAHTSAMGGAGIAMKPDSTMPIFVNMANPASYALIKLTALEVGGRFVLSHFTGGGNNLVKSTTNFTYGSLGFPVGRKGGAAFGIMPYSYVGYDTKSTAFDANIGTSTFFYSGNGGLNKAYIGYGLMPFDKRLLKFKKRNLNIPDSLKHLSNFQYNTGQFFSKLLSDFSIGFNVHYLFGSINNTTRVELPNSLLYNNTFRERTISMGDFTGNFGAQTAITVDSVPVSNKHNRVRLIQLHDSLKSAPGLSIEERNLKLAEYKALFTPHKRAMNEKVKFTMGFFMSVNNKLKLEYNSVGYNYLLNGSGQIIVRDSAYQKTNSAGSLRLPLEQGFGLGFKKGERINLVADFAITNWQHYTFLNETQNYNADYRGALGIQIVPEKYASGRGSFARRIHYRAGLSYQTGFIKVNQTLVSDYFISLGIGLPVGVGRLSSMVNASLQFGQMGSYLNNNTKQDYIRINFGFTFNDRWFQKMKYD